MWEDYLDNPLFKLNMYFISYFQPNLVKMVISCATTCSRVINRFIEEVSPAQLQQKYTNQIMSENAKVNVSPLLQLDENDSDSSEIRLISTRLVDPVHLIA